MERRKEVPINGTVFGSTFEVQIDAYGDVLTECAFEIDLPTWLPPLPLVPDGQPSPPNVANGLYPITTTDGGLSYGYCNKVGYFLFEKIQFYQDQFLLQEWSGDGLLAKQMTEGSWNSSYLQQVKAGLTPTIDPITNLPTARGIQFSATPGHLRVLLPLPGMQCPGDAGFPLVAMAWQTFRIKATLRKLEDLVVCSDPTVFKPAPWNVPEFTYNFDDGTPYAFQPLEFLQIGQPTILLSTIQHYLPPTAQQELRSANIQIPFRRMFENRFTFGELDYIPLDKGGTAAVVRQLDGRHPTERLFWFFRNSNSLDQNRLDNFTNEFFDINVPTANQPYTTPLGQFYYRMKLIIAGRDRELLHEPFLWSQVLPLVKDEKASGAGISTMKWSLGEQYGVVYPAARLPEGTVNMTTADRPTLYIELANVTYNAYLAQRKAEARVYTEGWCVYEVKGGRGRLLFAN